MATGVIPDVFSPSTVASAAASRRFRRGIVLLVITAALVAGFVMTDATAASHSVSVAGAEFARLMRGMALIKLAMAAAAVAALVWRLGTGITPAWLAAYTLSCCMMAAGPGLIWDMTYVRTGALLLHGGLVATVLLLWRDPAIAARLSALVVARKAMLGERALAQTRV